MYTTTVQEQEERCVSGDGNRNSGVSAPRLLTVEDVADRAELSMATIRRAIRLRHLAHYRIGRALRISEHDLADFLAERRRGAR
jgi:excisionase family DNA binding protein